MPKDIRGTKEFQTQLDKEEKEKTKWKPTHTQLELLAMGSLLIPLIGPLLSVAIELQDIEMYVKEKDYYNAGLFTIFMAIPIMHLVPPHIKKIVSGWTKDKIKKLVSKLKLGSLLDDGERIVVNYMNENTDQLKKGLDDLAQPKINQMISDPSSFRGGTSIQLPPETLAKIGKKGLRVASFLAPLIYIPAGYDAAVKSSSYISRLMDEQLHGESLLTKMEKTGYPQEIIRVNFGSTSTSEDEDKLKKILSDSNATYCGKWLPGRPIPLKYQTDTYKKNLNPNIIVSFEKKAKKDNDDCRFPGTYGSELSGTGNDSYIYKFLNGKYQVKKKGQNEWIDVTDTNMIKAIENLFVSNGLVKNQKLGIYEK
jgi:hypothetical protein